MRLTNIKIAGFKSFVDPTSIELQSNLVGVVGPNGCGKSNIIDAVRWVMGESSAKNLRGESMTDVIFNGSSSRKPVGQASIELVFDNSDASIGGEYAAFNDIAVRREVTRDGQSSYFLNGTKCRRRDVIDIFLGTGIGARSYSIIEQGMISRVIEARPEDLRAFIEEAAGISLYKKRRHDTELRIKHTRENLERLSDIRQEQEKHLEKLKRQSQAANKYKLYHAEQEALEVQLAALQWNDYEKDYQEFNSRVMQLSNQLEKVLSDKVSIDTEIETRQLEHTDKTDELSLVTKRFYDLGEQIARNEQILENHRQRHQQINQDLETYREQQENVSHQMTSDKEQIKLLEQQLIDLQPKINQINEDYVSAEDKRVTSENAMEIWSKGWQELQSAAELPQRDAEVQKSKIEQLEKQSKEVEIRIERITNEKSSLIDEDIQGELKELQIAIARIEQEKVDLNKVLATATNDIQQEKDIAKQLFNVIDEMKQQRQRLLGKKSSLEVLQEVSLGKNDAELLSWLETKNLSSNPRIAELLSVESGWEYALEIVLGNNLEALLIDASMQDFVKNFDNSSRLSISVVTNSSNEGNHPAKLDLPLLLDKIETQYNLSGLLTDVYCAESLEQATSYLPQIAVGMSIITRDGYWLGYNWLQSNSVKTAEDSVLQREKTLKKLIKDLEKLELDIGNNTLNHELKVSYIHDLEQKYNNHREKLQAVNEQLLELTSKCSSKQARLEHIKQRTEQLVFDLQETNELLNCYSDEMSEARSKLEVSITSMADFAKQQQEMQASKQSISESLVSATTQANDIREQKHQLEIKQQTLVTQQQAMHASLARLSKQLSEIEAAQQKLQVELDDDKDTVHVAQVLEEMLQQRHSLEEKLSDARDEVNDSNEYLANLDKQRKEFELQANELRETLDKIKIQWNTLAVKRDAISEQLTAKQIKIVDVLAQLPKDINKQSLSDRIADLTAKISRLGAINLAAIEEYDIELEKYHYMESQFNDLTEALDTLESAIAKIDKETKTKFKESYDVINKNFKHLFPKLFGGGEARLELTSDDLLTTGIGVNAKPPGKKNSSIHLLSGGEKALTAVSLVFAIFQLNPAPFCMLDEVDAPLDDANVGRFCNMIVEMSDKVQFIFISHNKLTMEIANQLMGVTMKEPGVSRLVSVDIDKAIKMAI